MEDTGDLEPVVGEPVNDNIGCPGHKELACAVYPAWSSHPWVGCKLWRDADESLGQSLSCLTIMVGSMIRGSL